MNWPRAIQVRWEWRVCDTFDVFILLSNQDSDPLFFLNRPISKRFKRLCRLSFTRAVQRKLRSQPTLPTRADSYDESLSTWACKTEKLSSPSILFSGLIVATTSALPFSLEINLRKVLCLSYWNLAMRLLLPSRDSWVNISILLLCDSSDRDERLMLVLLYRQLCFLGSTQKSPATTSKCLPSSK